MIYLITGVPGSGKTLYAVSTLVQKLAAEKIKGKDGLQIPRRVITDGIPNLLLPHDEMAPIVEDEKGNLTSDGDGLLNWWKWCRPGDIIVCDEVQRYWRPRGMGMKPPDMIKQLETHRHKGVDFVIITQNPMLIDQNVRRLVGRHQHIRRLFGMARALIYDWDGCSADVHRTKTATSSLWHYPKSAYKLYASSQLHTKQRQKIPAWLIVPALAVVGAFFVGPKAFSTMYGAMSGKGVGSARAAESKPIDVSKIGQQPAHTVVANASGTAHAAFPAASAPSGKASGSESSTDAPQAPVLAGCTVFRGECRCNDTKGLRMPTDKAVCEAQTDFGPVKAAHLDTQTPPLLAALDQPSPSAYVDQDVDALASIVKRRVISQSYTTPGKVAADYRAPKFLN